MKRNPEFSPTANISNKYVRKYFNSVFYFDQLKVYFSSKEKKLLNLWFKSKKER